MTQSARRKGRMAAVCILYAMDVGQQDVERARRVYWSEFAEHDDDREFADSLVNAYAEHREKIDALITEASHRWRLERMPVVDRSVLRAAVSELIRRNDIPRNVTLNEAVELAKTFGSEQSGAFVNGVLDRIANDLNRDA